MTLRIVLFLFIANICLGQNGTVKGKVKIEDQPIAYALIKFLKGGNTYIAYSNKEGVFTVEYFCVFEKAYQVSKSIRPTLN